MVNQTVLIIAVTAIVIAAAVIDWRTRRIPNILTLGGAFAGFALQVLFYGVNGLQTASAGWLVGFALLVPGYLLKQVGAGDVKLMATAGAFLGPLTALYAALASMLVGAAIALITMFFTRGTTPWARYGGMVRCLVSTGRVAYVPPQAGELMARSIPYGVAVAAGSLIVLADPLRTMFLSITGLK